MIEKLQYLFSKKPITLYFCATERCNSKCLQCNYWRKEHHTQQELTLDEIKSIFTDLYDFGVRYVFLAGGEALLRRDIEEIIAFMDAKRFQIILASNGMLLNEQKIKNLSKYKQLQIVFSLDSIDEKKFAIIRGINYLPKLKENLAFTKKYFGKVKVNAVVSNLNLKKIDEIIMYCKENDIYLSLYPYNESYASFAVHSDSMSYKQHTKEMHDLFKRLAKDCMKEQQLAGFSLIYEKTADWLMGKEIGRCAAGRDFLFLDYNGILRHCFYNHPVIGDLRNNKISEIFKLDIELIDNCNKNTPCFFGCTRSIAIVRENKMALIREAIKTNKIFTFLKYF